MSVYNLGPAVVSVAWIFVSISLAIVAARIWIRTRIVRKTSIDDYIIVFTLLLSLGNSVFLTVSTHFGLGQHIWELQSNLQDISYTVKYVYLCEFFSIMCPSFGRIAFALMLLSLVPPTNTRRRILYAIIVIAFVVDLGCVIVSFAQCTPIEAFWDMRPNANCWPKKIQQYAGFFQGSVGAAIDLVLAVFPTSLFWNLKMDPKQKIALSSIMGLGVFAMVASIVKTVQLRALTATQDLTYEMATLAIWWTLEANFVLIAVSIPALRPIMKSKKSTSQGYGGSGSGSRTDKTYELWKRRSTKDEHGSFEALHEPTHYTDTSISSVPESAKLGPLTSSRIQAVRRERSDDAADTIRRDITVEVVWPSDEPPRGTAK
jgi:hypothetical protein